MDIEDTNAAAVATDVLSDATADAAAPSAAADTDESPERVVDKTNKRCRPIEEVEKVEELDAAKIIVEDCRVNIVFNGRTPRVYVDGKELVRR